MTKEEIQAILERVKIWPRSLQEKAARVLLEIEALGGEPHVLSQDERRGVERGLDDLRQGNFASDDEMAALFARHRR